MLSALKNFGVTFLIAAMLFGILAYFATGFVASTMNSIMTAEEDELSEIMQNESNQTLVDAETGSPESQSPSAEKVPEGESFNFLIITTDYRPDLYNDYQPTLDKMYNTTDWYSVSASDTRGCLSGDYRSIHLSSVVLVSVDKEDSQYTYTYFSPETQVYTSTGHHNLSEVYNYYGKQTIAEHIHAMTGLPIRYTLILNAYNYGELTALCGAPVIQLSNNIYQTADMAYTTQVETTVEHIGNDGYPWTENIPNVLVLSAGELELTEENLQILNSIPVVSAEDHAFKESWTIAAVQAYLHALGTREDIQPVLTQLITNEAEWGNIEGIELPGEGEPEMEPEASDPESPEEGTVPETEPETPSEDEPYNPWEDTGGGSTLDSMDGEPSEETPETEVSEEEIDKIWLSEPFEPEGPILETDYTMNDFENIRELLGAVAYYKSTIVSYPGKYVAAVSEDSAYFDPDLPKGLQTFQQYRK